MTMQVSNSLCYILL